MARRLVEANVPFVTVFWLVDGINSKLAKKCRSAGGWDTHGNNFNCLKEDLLPRFDQCYSALIEDLDQRGLLDSTLVMLTSELGRKPKIGDPRSGGTNGGGARHAECHRPPRRTARAHQVADPNHQLQPGRGKFPERTRGHCRSPSRR